MQDELLDVSNTLTEDEISQVIQYINFLKSQRAKDEEIINKIKRDSTKFKLFLIQYSNFARKYITNEKFRKISR